MSANAIRWVVLGLGVLCAAPLCAQGISDPVGDFSPPWADYTTLWYQQQGESLYVALTFAGPISDKGFKHAGNTFYNDYDDNINTGQPGNVGSETNLTFSDWDGDNIWCMRIFALYDMSVNNFTFRSKNPVNISPDGLTMSYKQSLVGIPVEDVSFDANGYWLDGTTSFGDPYNQGDNVDNVQLYSFNPALITKLDSLSGTRSKIKFPVGYGTRAGTENITGALDELVGVLETEIGAITPTMNYNVTYNPFSDYPVFVYNAPPLTFFRTFIPGSGWVGEPEWWGMMEGAVFTTMSSLKLGYREIYQTQMAADIPLPRTPDGWYSTRMDSTHSHMWQLDHKPTFKAIIGRAIHNLTTIYIGEKLAHTDAHAAATAARTKAANAYAAFSGNAFDLDPWIMTGFLLNKLGSNLNWVKSLWTLLPVTFNLPTDTTSGDAIGRIVKPYLRDGKNPTDPYQQRIVWYPNIASIQAAGIDVATGGNIYAQLKTITNFPTLDSVYNQAKAAFQTLVSVGEHGGQVAQQFRLEQNYPNPFNPSTQITFTIPEKSTVKVKVFDILGREVVTLLNTTLNSGEYTVPWNAVGFTSGVYFVRLEAGKYNATMKAVLLK